MCQENVPSYIPIFKGVWHPIKKHLYLPCQKNRSFDNQFSKSLSPHLIGQKSGDFPPLRLKVYILFTEYSTFYLHCQKNRSFDNRISKNLSPHLYEKNRGFGRVFWKIIYSFFTKTKVSSSNRTKKWQNAPPRDERFRFCLQNLAHSTYIA